MATMYFPNPAISCGRKVGIWLWMWHRPWGSLRCACDWFFSDRPVPVSFLWQHRTCRCVGTPLLVSVLQWPPFLFYNSQWLFFLTVDRSCLQTWRRSIRRAALSKNRTWCRNTWMFWPHAGLCDCRNCWHWNSCRTSCRIVGRSCVSTFEKKP